MGGWDVSPPGGISRGSRRWEAQGGREEGTVERLEGGQSGWVRPQQSRQVWCTPLFRAFFTAVKGNSLDVHLLVNGSAKRSVSVHRNIVWQ